MDIAIVFMRCWTSGEKSMSVNLAAIVESTEAESVLLIYLIQVVVVSFKGSIALN